MISLVESRTDKVGHTSIDNSKLFVCSLFYVDNFSDKTSALTYYRTSQFEV